MRGFVFDFDSMSRGPTRHLQTDATRHSERSEESLLRLNARERGIPRRFAPRNDNVRDWGAMNFSYAH